MAAVAPGGERQVHLAAGLEAAGLEAADLEAAPAPGALYTSSHTWGKSRAASSWGSAQPGFLLHSRVPAMSSSTALLPSPTQRDPALGLGCICLASGALGQLGLI